MIGAALRRAAKASSLPKLFANSQRSMSSGPIDIATEIKELKKWKVRPRHRSASGRRNRGNPPDFEHRILAARHLRTLTRPPPPPPPRQAVTFLAIPVCGIKAFVDLSHEHEHGEDPPAYPYLRIRSKEFPWGDSGLFETEH